MAYSFDDWAVGQLAGLLNKSADAALMHNRSLSYRNIWEDESDFLCPRFSNGTFACNEDPGWNGWVFSDDGFCEGDQNQWRWFVPHDQEGLIQLFGREKFVGESPENEREGVPSQECACFGP